jgi:hypothetical protein
MIYINIPILNFILTIVVINSFLECYDISIPIQSCIRFTIFSILNIHIIIIYSYVQMNKHKTMIVESSKSNHEEGIAARPDLIEKMEEGEEQAKLLKV